MSRQRIPGDGPRCWCGELATFGGRCSAHAGTDTAKPIDPPRPKLDLERFLSGGRAAQQAVDEAIAAATKVKGEN